MGGHTEKPKFTHNMLNDISETLSILNTSHMLK